ncbi:MAG: hypothetical protein WAZ27_00320 [Minisyncoccia bacterium]
MNFSYASRFLGSVIIVGVLSIAAITLADIISGSSAVGNSSSVTITQIAVAKPVSTVEDDVLIAGIAVNGGSPANVTPPPGWNLISRTDNDADVSIISYWKVAGNSEPASYTWTINSRTRAIGGITRYSGVDTSSPISAAAGDSGRSTIAIAPSITTASVNEQIVTLYAFNAGATNVGHFSTPTGMSEKYDTTNTPFGPSLASHDALQAIAGASGSKSSSLGSGPQRNWVAQQIALKPAPIVITTEDFNSYSDGELSGGNGGVGWNDAWTGTALAQVQGDTVFEGSKAVKVSLPNGVEANIKRTFEQKNTGTLHWVQRKDQGSHGQGIVLYSGDTLALFAQVGSDVGSPGLEWVTTSGSGIAVFDPYTIGNWDTADIEFDSNTDQFRISINDGSFSPWMDFANPVDGIDGIALNFSAAGPETVDMYWDDIRFNE